MVHKNKRGGQSEKQMMENFSLDIFCQESIIGNIKKILFTEIRWREQHRILSLFSESLWVVRTGSSRIWMILSKKRAESRQLWVNFAGFLRYGIAYVGMWSVTEFFCGIRVVTRILFVPFQSSIWEGAFLMSEFVFQWTDQGGKVYESTTKTQQMVIGLHINCGNCNCGSNIYRSGNDGMGKPSVIYRSGFQ